LGGSVRGKGSAGLGGGSFAKSYQKPISNRTKLNSRIFKKTKQQSQKK